MVTPAVYSPGQHLFLYTGDCIHTFTIDKHFSAGTGRWSSVDVLAHCDAFSTSPVFVRIFDHKYLPLQRNSPSTAWTLEAECASSAFRTLDTDELDHRRWNDDPDDAESIAQRAAMHEEAIRRYTVRSYNAEKSAYEHLAHLQGTLLPRLLLTASVVPAEERAIRPTALVIEYIPDAVNLSNVSPDVLDPELCTALAQGVDSFGAHGVLYDGLFPLHILFAPKERPTRAVCIDFVCADIKGESEYSGIDPEEWEKSVEEHGDGRRLWVCLKKKCPTMPEPLGKEKSILRDV